MFFGGAGLQVGHGAGAFNWTVAEAACCEQGFWPDVISTDLHKMNNNGPAYDLPTVMTKFLPLPRPPLLLSLAPTRASMHIMREMLIP